MRNVLLLNFLVLLRSETDGNCCCYHSPADCLPKSCHVFSGQMDDELSCQER